MASLWPLMNRILEHQEESSPGTPGPTWNGNASAVFAKAEKVLADGLGTCREQRALVRAKIEGCRETGRAPPDTLLAADASLLELSGALSSAEAERNYCVASVLALQGKVDESRAAIVRSISGFSKAFRSMVTGALEERQPQNRDANNANPATTKHNLSKGVILTCAKDLGKACSFTDNVGGVVPREDPSDEYSRPLYPTLFLDFARIVSIYEHGSSHPTTKNIQRLSRNRFTGVDAGAVLDPKSLAEKYHAVAAWLVNEYGSGGGGYLAACVVAWLVMEYGAGAAGGE